jgi:putative transposase
MVRLPRLKIDDTCYHTCYHVFNRANQKQEVFHDDQDFETFLSIVAHYKLKYKFKIYHLCPMPNPNHFHFEFKIKNAEILPKAMKDITLAYTNHHHRKYGTVGQLWQGRYKNMIVEEQEYADKLGGYIERNPVRAGLVKEPGEWRWSSYRFYAYGEPLRVLTKWQGEKIWVDLIDEDPMYNEFGKTSGERQKNYQEFVAELDDGRIKEELGLVEKRRGRPRKGGR